LERLWELEADMGLATDSEVDRLAAGLRVPFEFLAVPCLTAAAWCGRPGSSQSEASHPHALKPHNASAIVSDPPKFGAVRCGAGLVSFPSQGDRRSCPGGAGAFLLDALLAGSAKAISKEMTW